jgi:hypothetical protein
VYTQSSTASTQTNSKQVLQSKSIGLSFIQILVHCLDKLVRNVNNKQSLRETLDKSRRRTDSEQIGDGTVHLARLLIKFERLSDQCRIQIETMVNTLETLQIDRSTKYVLAIEVDLCCCCCFFF